MNLILTEEAHKIYSGLSIIYPWNLIILVTWRCWLNLNAFLGFVRWYLRHSRVLASKPEQC